MRQARTLAVKRPPAAAASTSPQCRLCACGLDDGTDDNLELQLCSSCEDRPEARRLGLGIAPKSPRRPHLVHQTSVSGSAAARDFTPAEKSLIAKVHSYIPAQQLLDLLNERLACDLGPDAARYTQAQLAAEVDRVAPLTPTAGQDWASLRKLIAHARRRGLLERVTEQLINDFAIVWSLNPKQVMVLKDTLLDSGARS